MAECQKRDGTGREEGGGFRMGNPCIPMADSFWYLAKLIQFCKVKKKKKCFYNENPKSSSRLLFLKLGFKNWSAINRGGIYSAVRAWREITNTGTNQNTLTSNPDKWACGQVWEAEDSSQVPLFGLLRKQRDPSLQLHILSPTLSKLAWPWRPCTQTEQRSSGLQSWEARGTPR